MTSSGACAIVTNLDAEKTLRLPVRPPEQPAPGQCFHQGAFPGTSVMFQLVEGGREKFEGDKRRLKSPLVLQGIGDDAYAIVSSAGFVQLGFVKGGRYATLVVSKQYDTTLLEATKKLAGIAAARLP